MSLEIYKQLNSILIAINSSLAELLLALENEYQYLQHQDIDALMQVALLKKQISVKIEKLEKDYLLLVTKTGTSLEKNKITQLINNAAPLMPSLKENWQNIEQLGKQCADQNQVNGMILESNRRNIESRLAILRGQPLTPDSYSRNGRTSQTTYSKSLAQV